MLAVLLRWTVYGGVLLMAYWQWEYRNVYLTIEVKPGMVDWKPLLEALVRSNADIDMFGALCSAMYNGPVWLYRPPVFGNAIYYFTPEKKESDRYTPWAFTPDRHFERRYDGTASQQAEEAVAAEPD